MRFFSLYKRQDFLRWPPVHKKANPRVGFVFGAGEMNRTPDLLITNELLYRLSYTGEAPDYRLAW